MYGDETPPPRTDVTCFIINPFHTIKHTIKGRSSITLSRPKPSNTTMEGEKRKRKDDGEKKRLEEKVVTTDKEVEEFFAILRRIHVAKEYFQKNEGKRWKPSFQKEDFEVINGGTEPERKAEDCADESTGLDLNSDPPSDEAAV